MLVDRMNRAPSAIIHVRLRCWVTWMAAGTLKGGSSRWAASAQVRILRLRYRVVRRSLSFARLEARCLAIPLRSLPCGFFAYNIYLGVTFCAMMIVIRACFYGSIFCGDVVSSGTAPSQSSSGLVASRNFLFVWCSSTESLV